MKRKISILPCNGLDKSHGVFSREIALEMIQLQPSFELICPILYNANPEKYTRNIKDSLIVVIDGCATKCASKLFQINQVKISKRIFVYEKIKEHDYQLSRNLLLTPEEISLAKLIAKEIIDELDVQSTEQTTTIQEQFESLEFFEFTVDKYHFTVPKEGYYFNENDCWVKPIGNRALVGISDYLQNKSSDILFIDLPEVGKNVEQFDGIADFESSKALLELLTPISGKVTSVNTKLEDSIELLNNDPYQRGWIVEIEPTNLLEDLELLLNGKEYFDFMKKKIEDEL